VAHRAFPVIYSREVERAAQFYVDDVDDLVGRLGTAGLRVFKQPQDMPWGERVAYVTDPDGNPVALAAAAR
jgi:uncharacterized glyoxalase superfamily protein PhnB